MCFFMVIVFLCSSLFCIAQQHTYFISPHPIVNRTCTANGSQIIPCYSIHQLSEESALSNEGWVTLILLSGKHNINRTWTVSNIDVLQILPRNDREDTVVQCQLQEDLVFLGASSLKIVFLRFSGCSLKYFITAYSGGSTVVEIKNCVFAYSSGDYAISITNDYQLKVNVSIDSCTFSSNTGAVRINFESVASGIILITNTTFIHNNQYNSVDMTNANLTLNNSLFINNTAALASMGSSLTISYSVFQNNCATYGGAVRSFSSEIVVSHCLFQGNKAEDSGGAISHPDGSKSDIVIRNTIFRENHADYGGAISSTYLKIANCLFENNTAGAHGGALYVFHMEENIDPISLTNVNFTRNQALNGGVIYCETRSGIEINGGYSRYNSATRGGFVYLYACRLQFNSLPSYITDNSADEGGAIYVAKESRVHFFSPTTTILADNIAKKSGGAIFVTNSRINVNWASKVVFFRNSVTSDNGEGGAIFVLDGSNCGTRSEPNEQCFLEVLYYPSSQLQKPFFFVGNSAPHGSVLYGGLLDRCVQDGDYPVHGIDFFKSFSTYNHTPSALTSDPVKLCLCSTNISQQDCQVRELRIARMRGQQVHLKLTPVDQDRHSLESVVKANYEEPSAELGKGEGRQLLRKCNAASYHIFTVQGSATLVLRPEGSCEQSPLSSFTIHITLLPCPMGFEQHNDRCTCDRRLENYFKVRSCDINTNSIRREESNKFWLRYSEEFLDAHSNCLLDYCQVTSDTISLLSPDEQCANHRSGVICSACQENYSIALGSFKCIPCTSNYTFIWLTLVFAVAGMVLVALLLVLNMTISHGTLGGLIFYANVISTSGVMNLQNCSIHPILSVFIAWLNLDSGVETCFYPGMDTYKKTWLQFVFPIYIWLLVVAIIVASYYSSTAMKVFGRNNIAILATLFRLSYSKILKTIITALSATQLLRGKAGDVTSPLMPHTVWAYDGNIKYLKGKHVILFTVALLLLLFLFLPYTLLLTFGQCVRSMSLRNRYIQRIISSTAFISLMDAYHAPYRRKHRYWPGLILLTQCLLFICFAAAFSESQIMAKMYLTTLVVSGLLTLQTCIIAMVYKSTWLNRLHLWFLLNLLVLSATLNFLHKGSHSVDNGICNTTSASISVAFVTFFGILAYHAYLEAKKTRCYISVKHKLDIRKAAEKAGDNVPAISLPNRKHPSTTVVELREELLASVN